MNALRSNFKLSVALLTLAALVMVGLNAGASDHYDGDETSGHPTADISDLYVFHSERNGSLKLNLVLNVHPRAGEEAFFSDAIEYGFRIREGHLENTGGAVETKVGAEELRVICKFNARGENSDDHELTASCELTENDEVLTTTQVHVDDERGGDNPDFRVYAGLRSDPFFTDAGRIRLPRPRYKRLPSLLRTGNAMRPSRIALGVRANGPDSTKGNLPNVLSLVVEIDVKLLTLGQQLAIVGETSHLPDSEGGKSILIDKQGHVEVGPLLIADMTIADIVNQEAAYGLDMPLEIRAVYTEALQKGLVKYDNYDSLPLSVLDLNFDSLEQIRIARGKQDPDPTRLDWIDDLETLHPLMGVYLTDALFVDLSKPCGLNGYLEPELAALAGEKYQSCGGRAINEDVLDKIATVLINGPVGRGIHPDDDVDAEDADPYPDRGDATREPERPASDRFPFLAKPYASFPSHWGVLGFLVVLAMILRLGWRGLRGSRQP